MVLSYQQDIIGIFSSPAKTFYNISQQPVRHSYWMIPLISMIVVAILSNILIKSHPGIQQADRESSIKALEKQLDQAVEKGMMTTAQKENQLQAIETRLAQEDPSRFVTQSIFLLVSSCLNFFIASYVFLIFVKYFLKGKGKYIHALIAYAVPLYIIIFQMIVVAVLSLISARHLSGTSIAVFVNANTSTIGGFILSKMDPFLIWFYCIVGIGFAKMFGTSSVNKYIGMVFLLWLGSGLLFFFIAKIIPSIRWIVSM